MTGLDRFGRCLLAAALPICLLLQGCGSVFFYPQRPLAFTPAIANLPYRDVEIETADHIRLHGWYLPAEEARGTILFLHGNAGNVSMHLASVYWLPRRRYNVLMLDYRGFGESRGSASIGGSVRDADAAIEWLAVRPEVQAHGMAVFGQSIGGAIAAYAVAHSRERGLIRALILDSTFSSYRTIAREKLASWWLTWALQWPLSLTITDRYSPIDAIRAVSPIPVLIIHNEFDPIIPIEHGRKLYQAAGGPKQFWEFPQQGHITALTHEENRDRLVRYLDEVFSPSKSATGRSANTSDT
jgi:fermentation-respiration switch protein FrsA (DUF1100 family)